MTRKFLFILICFALTSSRCRNRDNGIVPYVPINIMLNIQTVDYFSLSVPGGYAYVTGGSRGLIVYRKTQTEFVVLERHSAYKPEDNCAVVVMDDGVIIDDPCSDSQWLIMDGTIVNGPAAMPLRTYSSNYQDPYLYITN